MKTHSAVTLLIIGSLLVGCSAKKDNETKQTEERVLPVVQLSTQSATLEREYVGNLEAVRNVEIRARVSGFLDKILIDEGQPVRKGQLLFQLNSAEYQMELSKANAALKSATAGANAAEVELERVRLLVDNKVISASELKVVKAKLEAARAAIEEAQSAKANAALRLAQASIRAPFDGIINRIPFKRGSLIDEGSLLTTISDIGEVYVYFDVSEKDYLEYIKKRKGPSGWNSQVDLRLADNTPYAHKGKVETMESMFEENSGTLAFRARFPNPEHLLKHGATGRIRLTNEVENALLVPQKAVFEIQDKNYVYVVGDSNKVTMRSFVPSGRHNKFYLVESGLKPGERIVYEGIQSVREGMQIVPKPVPTDSIPALVASANE
ncbi:efflux RND transporter periplasmic adaptor subunit [Nibrella saemangeumensis]|uniref:Efflux RND transporter periplasmic adaptor subunit n=1 Tax=Nibrella saemangeumensis TaxID=1084526 RepID=A0ABP8MHX1_9BACT